MDAYRMDVCRPVNKAELRGVLSGKPEFSHESRGEMFYRFSMDVERLSEAVDTINVICREGLIRSLDIKEAGKLTVIGELRSFNNKTGEGSKLVITVFARELYFDEGEDINNIQLTGALCKPATLRTTPMGRDICDLMLAVNRKYGRSDYLPCIAWGLRAKEAAELPIGTQLSLDGRIQSRRYIKNIDGIPTEKTAYEVSITDLSPVADND